MSEARLMLISGSSHGIGAALARRYAEGGDHVIGCGRTTAEFSHPQYEHHLLDVTDADAVREMFRSIRQRHGRLDVLINNAGVARMSPVALLPLDQARQMIEVNFLAAFALTQSALRLLRHASSGRIVNVSTVAVPLRLEGESVYAASKSALETLTRISAKEFGPLGITCNAIGPSPVRTQLTRELPEDKLQRIIDQQAVPRWAEPADVAHVVDFFLHPHSGMITGQVIYLGGFG